MGQPSAKSIYDPATARFTQEDPIRFAGGINLYGLAGGDAVNFGDPFGLCDVNLNGAAWCAFVNGVARQTGALGSAGDAVAKVALEVSGANDVMSAIGEGSAVGVGFAVAGMLPVGRAVSSSSRLVSGAAAALAKRTGHYSASIVDAAGVGKRVDLIGSAHASVPTPHVDILTRHTNPLTGASRIQKTFGGRPATRQDIVDAARFFGQFK